MPKGKVKEKKGVQEIILDRKAPKKENTKSASKGSLNENKKRARPAEKRQINLESYILKKKGTRPAQNCTTASSTHPASTNS